MILLLTILVGYFVHPIRGQPPFIPICVIAEQEHFDGEFRQSMGMQSAVTAPAIIGALAATPIILERLGKLATGVAFGIPQKSESVVLPDGHGHILGKKDVLLNRFLAR